MNTPWNTLAHAASKPRAGQPAAQPVWPPATPMADCSGHALSGFVAYLQQTKDALYTELCSADLDFFDRHAVRAQMDGVDYVLGQVNDYVAQAGQARATGETP